MEIKKRKNNLVISFEYDAIIVSIVSSFLGRKYNKNTKEWTVPVSQIESVMQTLKPFGFHYTADVYEAYKKDAIIKLKAKRLREGLFKDNEQAALEELHMPLFKYQQIGAGYIAALSGALLGDQPGLGKTIQSLAASQLKDAKKVLVFCPVSMKKTWQEEIDKWLPGQTSTIVGGSVKDREKQWTQDTVFYICNYHLILRDMSKMKAIDWDFVIADEATVLSNYKAKTTIGIKKIPTRKKLALTGTPLNNSVQDIWSIMDWLYPGILGSYWQFMDTYCVKDAFGSIAGYKNLGLLKEKIGVFMLRRLKKDVLTQLPPKLYENIYVEFTQQEKSLYEAIKEETMHELAEAQMFDKSNLDSAMVKLIRLKQMTCSSELINGSSESSKLEALKELLTVVLEDGEKTIIFTQFRTMATVLMRELAQYNPVWIAGGVSAEERDANRKMFQEDDIHKILIMTSAGQFGLNLQRASSVIHYDLPWSISALEQREDRAHRQGQQNNVTIYKLIVQDTVDEYVLKVLHRKKRTSDAVLGDEVTNNKIKKVTLSRADMLKLLG